MALFRRARKHPQDRGMSPFRAGAIALVLIALGTFFGFTKTNPFASPYQLQAVFKDTSSLQVNSPVRTAGVEVGKVKKVENIDAQTGTARVTMELKDSALPLHQDATLAIRPRIFLEGNFFVDLRPGSPSSPVLDEGEAIPMTQTHEPVQLGEVLTELNADVRGDLRTLLAEYSLKGLAGNGADAFNRASRYFEPAYRDTAIATEALQGTNPQRDLPRVLKGQTIVARALTVDKEALKDLVTNLNTTAGALASEDDALRASVPALRDTLRVGSPALASVNGALPSLRAFAVEALPGVRSSDETLAAATPFARQLRLLLRPAELGGTAAELRRQIPSLVGLNTRLIPFLRQAREASSCTNHVLVPYSRSPIPSGEPGNTGQKVREQINRSLVGLGGESRTNDSNSPFFRVEAVSPTELSAGQVEPVPPTDVSTPPPHRPDVPCETQDPPNLNAPSGNTAQFTSSSRSSQRQSRVTADLQKYMKSKSFNKVIAEARKKAKGGQK